MSNEDLQPIYDIVKAKISHDLDPIMLKFGEALETTLQHWTAYKRVHLFDNNREPDILLRIVDGTSFNASVFKHKDRYFVGINEGVLQYSTFYFFSLLSNPALFPEVGSPALETKPKELKPWIDANDFNFSCNQNEVCIPTCKRRSLFALSLALRAAQFVLGHEINHVYRGHYDFWCDHMSLQGSLMQETPSLNLTNEQKETRYLLEWDADQISLNGLIAVNLQSHLVVDESAGDDPPPTQAEIISTCVYATATVIHLLSERERRQGPTEYYPSMMARTLSLRCAVNFLNQMNKNHEDNSRLVNDAVVSAGRDFASTMDVSTSDWKNLVEQAGKKNIQSLQDWKPLAKGLKKFAYS